MKPAELPAYVDAIVAYLQSPSSVAIHGITSVQRLGAADLNKMPSPGIGVFLLVPQPTQQDLQTLGNSAIYNWQVIFVINSEKTVTKEQGWISAFTTASAVVNLISNPSFSNGQWDFLHPDGSMPCTVYDNTDSLTTIGVCYVINAPI